MAFPLRPEPLLARVHDLPIARGADVERRTTGVDDEHVEVVGLGFDRGVGEPRDRRECGSGVDAVQRLLAHVVEPDDAT